MSEMANSVRRSLIAEVAQIIPPEDIEEYAVGDEGRELASDLNAHVVTLDAKGSSGDLVSRIKKAVKSGILWTKDPGRDPEWIFSTMVVDPWFDEGDTVMVEVELAEDTERDWWVASKPGPAESGIPPFDHPQARLEWFLTRSQALDTIRGEDWLRSEIETLWNNPHRFADEGLYDPPDEIDEEDYALFTMGLLFGIDYERYFPTGNRGEWLHTGDWDGGE